MSITVGRMRGLFLQLRYDTLAYFLTIKVWKNLFVLGKENLDQILLYMHKQNVKHEHLEILLNK